MIDIIIQESTSGIASWLVPTLAGLVGALFGGGASLLATRSANRHAVRLLRLERREEAADAVLGGLWRAINTKDGERTGRFTSLVSEAAAFDRRTLLWSVYDLANRSAGDEPLVERLCHDFAWRAGYGCDWEEFRAWCAALSAGLTRWRKNPGAFRREQTTLDDCLAQLPEAMALRDAAKEAGEDNPSASDVPPSRRAEG